MRSHRIEFFDAVVITREIVGRDTATTEEIAKTMLASQVWRAAYRNYTPWKRSWFVAHLHELRWPK